MRLYECGQEVRDVKELEETIVGMVENIDFKPEQLVEMNEFKIG